MNGNYDWDILVQTITERDENGDKLCDSLEGSYRKSGSKRTYKTVYARTYEELFDMMGTLIAREDAKVDRI